MMERLSEAIFGIEDLVHQARTESESGSIRLGRACILVRDDGVGVWGGVNRGRDVRLGGAGKCSSHVCEVLGGMEMLGWLGLLLC